MKICFVELADGTIDVVFDDVDEKREPRQTGKSLILFPDEFTVVDIETTGFDTSYCEIIEFAGIRIKNGVEVERFQTLINPQDTVSEFILDFTGLTQKELDAAPLPKEVSPLIQNFIGESIVVAHNAPFDVNFLYDYFKEYSSKKFDNNFVCTLRLARRAFPDLRNHKLQTLCEALEVPRPKHRGLIDAEAALSVFNACREKIQGTIGLDAFYEQEKKRKTRHSFKASEIRPTVESFDYNHPLCKKTCVFTGALSKIGRREAMQAVVNLGGSCTDRVTKKTDYLIMGQQDYSRFVDGERSSKLIKAEDYIKKGHDIEIISENTFYELLEQEF